MLFHVVFIIIRCIYSKCLAGVRASKGRIGQKMDIRGEGGDPYFSPKYTPHRGVCFACRARRNIFTRIYDVHGLPKNKISLIMELQEVLHLVGKKEAYQ